VAEGRAREEILAEFRKRIPQGLMPSE